MLNWLDRYQMNGTTKRISYLMWAVLVSLLFSSSVYSMTPLSEEELSDTTAQDGSTEEAQLNAVLLTSVLMVVASKVEEVVPIDADIVIDGVEYHSTSTAEVSDASSEALPGLTHLVHPNVVGVDRIEFNNIRLDNSLSTFGNVHISGVEVDQQLNISVPR